MTTSVSRRARALGARVPLVRRWAAVPADNEDHGPTRPVRQQAGRMPVLGVLAATMLGGLLFGPVFGSAFPTEIYVPVLAVVAALYLCFELVHVWPAFEDWRAMTSVVLGLLVIVETTLRHTTAGLLPTGESLRALWDGARKSWLLTLQSTLPASPDATLVVFVPLLVLAAGLVAVHTVTRTRARLLSLLPPLIVAGLSQAFYPLTSGNATLVVLGFAFAAAIVLGRVPRLSPRVIVLVMLAAVPAIVLGALAGAAFDPVAQQAYALQNEVSPPAKLQQVTNPLDAVEDQLNGPDDRLFTVQGSLAGVDRWPIALYSDFNGSQWRQPGSLRNVGARLDVNQPTVVSAIAHRAQVSIQGLPGPFVPSQDGLSQVTGPHDLRVFQDTGTLVFERAQTGTHYRLGFTTPKLTSDELESALVSPHRAQSVNDLDIDPKIDAIAEKIAGDAPPTIHTAVAIEDYLVKHYKLATGKTPPGGHGLPQITRFLTKVPVGTSVQFATAYVLLARILGIPARLAVGYRQPAAPNGDGEYQITSHDAFAWPEVSVRGIGWIQLDPTANAKSQHADQSSVQGALNKVRQQSPPPTAPTPQPRGPGAQHAQKPPQQPAHHGTNWWLVSLLVVMGVVLFAGLSLVIGIPAAKWLRNRARRRRRGNSAIVSAWLETRDRLRDHGVAISADMTVRDVRKVSGTLMNPPAAQAMERLGDLVDSALWAGTGPMNRYPPDVAWGAYDTVRNSLAHRPIGERLVAGLTLRSLRPLQ